MSHEGRRTRVRGFQSELRLPPPEQVLPFFAEARNFDAVPRSWLQFSVAAPRTAGYETAGRFADLNRKG